MRILLSPNAFKGSLTAVQAAEAMARAVSHVLPTARVERIPLADGGDGTAETLLAATSGRRVTRTVPDPLGRPVEALFGVLGDGKTAILEMAEASGLKRLQPGEYDPLATSTRGTGELIRAALDENVETVLLGIGGSATNDGGMGMATALGARFLDDQGRSLEGQGKDLEKVRRIDLSGLDPRLASVRILCACDVENPLTGPHGAARVYGPQKGASPQEVERLDAGLRNLADRIRAELGRDIEETRGAGAAGGLGGGILAFLGGALQPGVDLVMEHTGFLKRLPGATLVLTGEGRIDGSTRFGKVPAGVARRAREQGIPVFCFAGGVEGDLSGLHEAGLTAIFPICPRPMDLEQAMEEAEGNLERAVEEGMRAVFLRGGKAFHYTPDPRKE